MMNIGYLAVMVPARYIGRAHRSGPARMELWQQITPDMEREWSSE